MRQFDVRHALDQARHVSPPANWTGAPVFRSFFDNAPFGMLVADRTGTIIAVNAKLRLTFGYREEELVGSRVEMLIPSRIRDEHRRMREGYATDAQARPMGAGRDLTGRRRDGVEFPVEIGLCAIDSELGPLHCATVFDITERKRAELHLREANARLEEFSSVASHDLRSPIRGISSLIEFLRDDLGDDLDPEIARHIARMEERVTCVERLIADLLAYARAGKRNARLEPIDLGKLLSWVIDLEAAPDGFDIEVDVPDETFDGALTPLGTVLRNLVANAIRHHDREQGHITVTARYEGSFCVIEVTDDGPGIPVASQARAFRLFNRLGGNKDGSSGLGLALVQRLVEGHGGSISLHSNDDERGTRFTVRWPRFPRTDFDA